MPLIIPSNSISAVGYEVDNSLRFDSGSSDNLTRTPSSAGNRKTFTISFWVKRCKFGSNNYIMATSTGTSEALLVFFNGDKFDIRNLTAGSGGFGLTTNRLFRDSSAWYHFVVAVDTTQATSSNRVKIYVNGTQETSLETSNYPTQNEDLNFNSTIVHTISGGSGTSNFLNGYLAEYLVIDGQALDPTSFGEFDADTGIWKPIDVSGLTFGTNGFYLDFENSGSLGADVSGNGNNFTVNNLTSIDQTTDTPTNNYATLNPLAVPTSNAPTFADGNCKTSTNDGALFGGVSTFAVTQGKWYVEAKRISQDSGSADDGFRIGFGVTNNTDWNTSPVSSANSGHYYMIGNGTVYNGSTSLGDQAGDSNISDNGVVQIALDLDNNQISWGFNGGWMDGANGWTNSTPSTWISITDPASTEAGYFFLSTDGSTIRGYTASWNFGNPPFTISSGNSDGNGMGNFEYSVPSGYYSLNTKNLAEFG